MNGSDDGLMLPVHVGSPVCWCGLAGIGGRSACLDAQHVCQHDGDDDRGESAGQDR